MDNICELYSGRVAKGESGQIFDSELLQFINKIK